MAVENGYIELPVVKAALDITRTGDEHLLEIAIGAASRAIDEATGRRFWRDAAASSRVYRTRTPYRVDVDDFDPNAPVTVETDDNDDGTFETTWAATEFLVEPLNAIADKRPGEELHALDRRLFPTCGRRPLIRVTTIWGWPAFPAPVVQACHLITGRLFARKDAPFGIVGGSPEEAAVRITRDNDVRELLGPLYKGTGFA